MFSLHSESSIGVGHMLTIAMRMTTTATETVTIVALKRLFKQHWLEYLLIRLAFQCENISKNVISLYVTPSHSNPLKFVRFFFSFLQCSKQSYNQPSAIYSYWYSEYDLWYARTISNVIHFIPSETRTTQIYATRHTHMRFKWEHEAVMCFDRATTN